jgi:hypothetical protein
MTGIRHPNRWFFAVVIGWGVFVAGTASLIFAPSCGEDARWEIREIAVDAVGQDITPTMDVRDGDMTLWVNYFDDGEDRHLKRLDYDKASGVWEASDVRIPNEPNGLGRVIVHELDGRVRALSRVYGFNRQGNNYTYLDGYAGPAGAASSEWYSIDRFKTLGGKHGSMVWIDFFAFYRDGVLYGHHQNSDLFEPSLFVKAGADDLVHELERFSFDTLALDDSHRHGLLGGAHSDPDSYERVFYVLDDEGRPTIEQPGTLGSSEALAVGSDGALHAVWFHDGEVVSGWLEPGGAAWRTAVIGPRGAWEEAHLALDEHDTRHFVIAVDGEDGRALQYVRSGDGGPVVEPIVSGLTRDTRVLEVNATDTALHVLFQEHVHAEDTSFHHATRKLD